MICFREDSIEVGGLVTTVLREGSRGMWRDFELILNSWRDFELICFREDSIEVEGLVKTGVREGLSGYVARF